MIPTTLAGCLFLLLDAFIIGVGYSTGCAMTGVIMNRLARKP